MNCTHSDHQGKKIESICLNSECDFNYFCCKKCEKEFHKSHTDDCFDLEDDFDQKFQKMVSTQNSLIKKLQSLVDTISVKSGKHIKQLEYDLNTLKQFGPLIKDLEVGQIAKHILIVKHLNSLQSEGDKLTQMGKQYCQIQNHSQKLSTFSLKINKLDNFQEELNKFLIETLNPSIKLIREALQLSHRNFINLIFQACYFIDSQYFLTFQF